MTLHYSDIYSKFLAKITDYSFLEYDEQFIQESMKDWLHSSASLPYIMARFSTLSFDDELIEITFELKSSVNEEYDKYFVSDILARGMVIEWLEPQVKNVLLTKQFFGGKEEKMFSQSQHLKELQILLSDAKTELRKIIRDYGYFYNPYIGEQ